MDHQQLLSFPMLLTFLFFIFVIWKLWKNNNSSTPNLPPGPWKLPVIGSIHHLLHPLPHRRLRDLAKKYGPIMYLQVGEIPTIIISSPETAKEILKTHDINFADRPFVRTIDIMTYNGKDIGEAPYGEYWRELRKICTLELLTMKRVQSFRSIREEELSKTIESICSSAGSPVNISELLSYLTYGIISRAAFGKVWNGKDVFLPAVQKLVVSASTLNLADIYPSVKFLDAISGVKSRTEKFHKELDVILEDILNEHKARRREAKTGEQEGEDLVDVLLKYQDDGNLQFSLANDNIKAVILDMFVAGSETSSTTVVWAMAEMMKNPRVLKKAQEELRQLLGTKAGIHEESIQELSYLKLVIKETLRVHPPLPLLIPRECRENCVINNYDIPAKSKVMVNAWAIGRDPDQWIDAEKFFPERFLESTIDFKGNNFEFLPFGAGRRMCPGILFGMANVEFPLAMLLYHFDWKLPAGLKPEDVDMTERFGAVVGKRNDLYLIPTPYHSPFVN